MRDARWIASAVLLGSHVWRVSLSKGLLLAARFIPALFHRMSPHRSHACVGIACRRIEMWKPHAAQLKKRLFIFSCGISWPRPEQTFGLFSLHDVLQSLHLYPVTWMQCFDFAYWSAASYFSMLFRYLCSCRSSSSAPVPLRGFQFFKLSETLEPNFAVKFQRSFAVDRAP